MIFDKSRQPNGKGNVLFIDAGREFAQNTNQNKLRPQDIDKIVDTFKKHKIIEKYSYLASYAEIEENEFNLNIPRYVDTFEPEEDIDIAAVQQEIEQIARGPIVKAPARRVGGKGGEGEGGHAHLP